MPDIEIKNGQHWRHRKSGGVYEIVEINCHVECSSLVPSDGHWIEDEMWIAYRNINGGTLCFRMTEEFGDGRFELVKEAEA